MNLFMWLVLGSMILMTIQAWTKKKWKWIPLIPTVFTFLCAYLAIESRDHGMISLYTISFWVTFIILLVMCIFKNPLAKNVNKRKVAKLKAEIMQREEDKVYKEQITELKKKIKQIDEKKKA